MVVSKDKWIVKTCRNQVVATMAAIATLDPGTEKGHMARSDALELLASAMQSLDTLYRHYSAMHRRKPPPKEGHHDLP